MPPPCCIVSAASRRWAKMPPMSSGIAPITKQLNSVTSRAGPGAGDDPPGRQELEIAHRRVEPLGPLRRVPRSARQARGRRAARYPRSSCRPARRLVAGACSRYFMSQICCEIEATLAISGGPCPQVTGSHCTRFVPVCRGWKTTRHRVGTPENRRSCRNRGGTACVPECNASHARGCRRGRGRAA